MRLWPSVRIPAEAAEEIPGQRLEEAGLVGLLALGRQVEVEQQVLSLVGALAIILIQLLGEALTGQPLTADIELGGIASVSRGTDGQWYEGRRGRDPGLREGAV